MADEADALLSQVVGGTTVGANLDRAIAQGSVRRREDGRYELASAAAAPDSALPLTPYIGHRSDNFRQPCRFLNEFLFRHVYDQAAVPFGCRTCYKVKVVSRSLRQLMAVKAIAEAIDCTSKSGPEVSNADNPHPYGTYFYVHGLERARDLHKLLRAKLDDDERLGQATEMFIKRGCTNYEHKCGPSDRYSFDPALEAVEDGLLDRFVMPADAAVPKEIQDGIRLLEMVHVAYRIGDETYRDFTEGRSLAPQVVRYPPEG